MEQLEELFKELSGMKGFYRQEGGAWELLTKTKKGFFLGQVISF